MQEVHGAHSRPYQKLKTWRRFCPTSSAG